MTRTVTRADTTMRECVIARRATSFETLQQTRITVDDTYETGNRP